MPVKPHMSARFMTPAELQETLGANLKAIRLDLNLTQADVAGRADVSERALRKLEAGTGSTVETLLRVMRVIGLSGAISRLAPMPDVDPIALADRAGKQVKRAGKPRKKRPVS